MIRLSTTSDTTAEAFKLINLYLLGLKTNRGSRGGGGGALTLSYIRRLGSFLGFKILNFNIFWG